MMTPFSSAALRWVAAAIVLFVLTLLLARVGVPEFSHLVHPLALRGAVGLPGAKLFNAGAFLLPGISLLLAAHALRPAVQERGWMARLGLTLAQLSVLAFALQGAMPLDQRGVEELTSRLHVSLWMLWWIAFVPAMLLLALGAKRGKGFAVFCLGAGLLLPVLTVLAPIGAWVGLAQRLAYAVWLLWWLGAALWLRRAQ